MVVEVGEELGRQEEVSAGFADLVRFFTAFLSVDINSLPDIRSLTYGSHQMIMHRSLCSRIHTLIDLIYERERHFGHLQQADKVHHGCKGSFL